MNILFVVPYVPDQIRVRPYNFIRSLEQRGHRVSLLTLWTSPWERESLAELNGFCHRVEAVHLPRWQSIGNALAALPTSAPLQASYSWSHTAQRALRTLLEQEGDSAIQVVHVEHLRGSRYALEAAGHRNGRRIPIVWDSVDCISELFRLAAEHSRSGFGQWVTRFELPRTRTYEASMTGAFDRVLVTSEADRRALLALPGVPQGHAPIRVVPNGVDLDYFHPPPAAEREPATIVMTGKMSYHANVTMALNFAQLVFPLIQRMHSNAKLIVVGKDPAREVQALGENPAITVTGTVADIRPYLWRASVAVAPLAYAVGIQNKVLEAMACATPVVVSRQAADGIGLESGQQGMVASNSGDFANIVHRVLESPRLQAKLGTGGRRFVEERHDWHDIAGQLEEVYLELVNNVG